MPLVRPRSHRPTLSSEALARNASLAMWAIAGLLFLGSLIDFAVLWLGQRQPTAQWEYVALTNTLEGMWAPVLAAALAYMAFHLGGLRSRVGYRLLAGGVIGLGVIGGALGLLLATDYFALRGNLAPEATQVFNTATLKGVGLSALYLLFLVPLGIAGFRVSKREDG